MVVLVFHCIMNSRRSVEDEVYYRFETICAGVCIIVKPPELTVPKYALCIICLSYKTTFV